MTFLEQIAQYWFLTEETMSLLKEGFEKGLINEKEQAEVIATCEKTKADLAAEELKLLAVIEAEQLKLMQETHKLQRNIHVAEENFDRKGDTAEIANIEKNFS